MSDQPIGEAIDERDLVFCTVVTRSHLRYAEALRRSLRRFHADTPFVVLIVDAWRADPPPEAQTLDCAFLYFDDLPKGPLAEMAVYYDAYELCGNSKPYLILHLFETLNVRRVIYLDSDIFVVGRFDLAISRLERAEFLATPHILTPMPEDGVVPNDVEIVQAGVYNAGFLAFANTGRTRKILAWMARQVVLHGFNWPERGMMCEQKHLSLAATFFQDGFSPIFDPGYNVAYWNLHERQVACGETGHFVGSSAMTFFHFSGFDIDKPALFTRYSTRFLRQPGTPLDTLLTQYEALFENLPFPPWRRYGHASHAGVLLNRYLRRCYFLLKRLPTAQEAATSGERMFRRHRYAEAEEALGYALSLAPEDAETAFYMGACRMRQGRTAEAVEDFRRVLRTDPDHKGALGALATVAARARRERQPYPEAATYDGA